MGSFLRISYLVLPTPLVAELNRWGLEATEVPLIPQIMLKKFLKEGYFSKHINRVQTHYRKVREAMVDYLKQIDEVEIKGAGVGLYFVIEFKREIPTSEVIQDRALKQNIFIESVDKYRTKGPKNPQEYIIGFGSIPPEDIKESVDALMSLFRLP